MRRVLAVCEDIPWFCSEETETMTPERFSGMELDRLYRYKYIIAGNGWEKSDKRAMSQLLSYAANGGGVLGYRCERPMESPNAMSILFGARHEISKPQNSAGVIINRNHPITKETEQLDLDGGIKKYSIEKVLNADILIEYMHHSKRYPVMWAHKYGLGRVVYSAFGLAASDEISRYDIDLFKRMGLWLQGKI